MFYGCHASSNSIIWKRSAFEQVTINIIVLIVSIIVFQLIIGHISRYWFKLFKEYLTHDAAIWTRCIYTTSVVLRTTIS